MQPPPEQYAAIFEEYDRARNAYNEVESINELVKRVNQKIKGEIRDLRPCYPGTDKYNHAEIYPDYFVSNHITEDQLRPYHNKLMDLWEESPYDYEIPAADQKRIHAMARELCGWEKFMQVYTDHKQAETTFDEAHAKLMKEYYVVGHSSAYLDDLLKRYHEELSDSANITWGPTKYVHDLEHYFITDHCDIKLIPRPLPQ